MKLIIDIPDNEYQYTCDRTLHDRSIWDNAIRNGTPLDDVKAEIQEKSVWYSGQTYDGLCMALKIIDKYKAESEE